MTAHSQLHEPMNPQRRRDRVQMLMRRMADRANEQHRPAPRRASRTLREQIHRRMKRRKAAVAFSAGVKGMSSAAMASPTTSSAETTGIVELANALVRLPASDLHASESFKQALVEEEGVRDVVYRDVAGYPTVGVGHLVSPADGLKVGDKVSYDK